ncbi:MAG: T9SS type A sorting domain-containing protein, partial [Salibacteraceae bacterium]
NSIIATPDGGALIASSKYDWNSPYPDQWDIHLLKVDSLGNYTPLGEEEIIEPNQSIGVYPNPAQNQITITGVSSYPSQLTVYDVLGRVVLSEVINSPSQQVDVSELPKGTVIYRITSSNSNFSGRLILK